MAGEWTTATLGELCEFRAGSVFKPALQGQSSGSYPFVKVSDMNLPANAVRIQDANNWVSEDDLRELRARPFPRGTVVFAKIGEALRQNRLRQVARETIADNNMMGAVPTTSRVDPRFFYYALSQFDFSDIAQGTALPYLTVSALSALTLDVPPLPEQRAIAHILGALDDKIELNRRMNETLETMARAIFKSWFVDFDPVRAKAEDRNTGLPRQIADLFADRFKDSELGRIPAGWNVVPFGSTVEIHGGGTPKTSVPEYWNGDISWYAVGDAPRVSDVYVIDTEKRVTRAGVENSATHVLPIGTTIISARGTVGKLALTGVSMAMNQTCYGLQGKNGGKAFFTFFSTRNLVVTLQQNTHGSVFDTITRDTLNGVKVAAPGPMLIERFEAEVAPVTRRILNSLWEIRTLAAVRDTLLPRLLSGEIRIKGAGKSVKVRS